MIKTLAVLVAVMTSASAFSDTFRHTIWDAPYTDMSTCFDSAKAAGNKIAEDAKVTLRNTECEINSATGSLLIRIEYEAPKALNFVTTSGKFSYTAQGFFESEKDCVSQIAEQENIFQTETGLRPFISFCHPSLPGYKKDYEMMIQGVGTPKRAPFFTNIFTSGSIQNSVKESMTAKLSKYLAEQNARLVYLAFSPKNISERINLFYYGEKEIKFINEMFHDLPDAQTCEVELQTLEQAFVKQGVSSPLAYCTASPGSPTTLYFFLKEGVVKSTLSLETFSDYSSCAKAQVAVMNKYQALYGDKLMTGICNRPLASNVYRLSLIVKK